MARDPFEPRDPHDTTPPLERDLKAWIAQFYKAKAAQADKESNGA